MENLIVQRVSVLAQDIKKLIEETEPLLLINRNLSDTVIENTLDNSFGDFGSPPWPGEWDNE